MSVIFGIIKSGPKKFLENKERIRFQVRELWLYFSLTCRLDYDHVRKSDSDNRFFDEMKDLSLDVHQIQDKIKGVSSNSILVKTLKRINSSKEDPGELFNWHRLDKKNLAYYPSVKKYAPNKIFFKLGDRNKEIGRIKSKLIKIGYKCSQDNYFDIYLKLLVEAFQRRFLPEKINGIIDGKVYSRILDVSKNA